MKQRKDELQEIAQDYFDEAIRYYKNAKEVLKSAKIEYNLYVDTKPVAEACAMGYLGILKAIDGYLTLRGVDKAELPHYYNGYLKSLSKYLAHDGKLRSSFVGAYDVLHVLGYYRDSHDVDVIKTGFQRAKFIIEHLSHKKIPKGVKNETKKR
jgi:hypothetical protein